MSTPSTRARLSSALCACGVVLILTSAAFAADGVVSSDWQHSIFEGIERLEYEFSSLNDGTFTAPNRTHDLRTFVSEEGLRLTPRSPLVDPWEIRMNLVGVGRGEHLAAPGPMSLSSAGGRVERAAPGITEWFRNDPAGLEHGFTLDLPPAGPEGRPVRLAMQVSGDLGVQLRGGGQELSFSDRSGNRIVRYAKLVIEDADGTRFPAHMELEGRLLSIVVDDRGATYPLVVDPLVTTPDWSVDGGQLDARLGFRVAAADVNGDGYDDVIVGCERFDNIEFNEGRVFVYHGSPAGPPPNASWFAEGNQDLARFGQAVESAGDVNNDGYEDVILGAPRYDDTLVNEGAIFVYYGSSTGLDANGTRPEGTPANPDWWAKGGQVEAFFGVSAASAGSVNGDPYDDIVVGADEYDNPQTDEGAAFVFYGSPTGLNPDPGGAGDRAVGHPSNADWVGDSNRVEADYGFSVSGAGDVNGDLYDDVLIGAPTFSTNFIDEGRVFLYRGGPSGLEATPVWMYDGGTNNARLGTDVASAGNVNGDFYDDIILGADGYTNGQDQEGGAFVFHGLPSGLLGTNPQWVVEGEQVQGTFGHAVSSVGDFNNDGFDDVIVGADELDNGSIEEGAVFLYFGSSNGLDRAAARVYELEQEGAQFGRSVAAGDVDGDGYDDLIAGADRWDRLLVDEGGAFVFLGCQDGDRDGVCNTTDNCLLTPNPDQLDADADGIGDVCDPCLDVDVDGVCDEPRALVEPVAFGEVVIVQFGSLCKYLANYGNPGLAIQWVEEAFNDLTWNTGFYGMGYDQSGALPNAHDLLVTPIPPGAFSLYTRADFIIPNIDDVETVFLGMDYDDAYVAWINGTEVFRSGEMPAGFPDWNVLPSGHESSNGDVPDYGTLHDITFTASQVMHTGINTLAVGVWNDGPQSSDLVIVPRLSINRPRETTITYLANSSDPGAIGDWTQLDFDDAAWAAGNYGIGYEAATGAEGLLVTDVEEDTVSLFSRAKFRVAPGSVQSMFLGADYDDGYVAWLNGTEIYRSPEMPLGPTAWDTEPLAEHESSNAGAPDFGTLIDVTGSVGELLSGENVLALGAWSRSPVTDDDLVLAPRLSINEENVDNCIGIPNPGQENFDNDDLGDVCDPDGDGDGILDDGSGSGTIGDAPCTGGNTATCDDNCRYGVNSSQDDSDSDGVGDLCDVCADDPGNDIDGDGYCAGLLFMAPKTGAGDNCPLDYNPDQANQDGDDDGDLCDPDRDGDLILDDGDGNGTPGDNRCTGGATTNCDDNCPTQINPLQEDGDSDGYGTLCDCSDADPAFWLAPSAVETLAIEMSGATAQISWLAPTIPGAATPRYDTVRAASADGFDTGFCLDPDGTDLLSTDSDPVSAGSAFFYLVRIENDCFGGSSATALDSEGAARNVVACP